MKQATHWGTCQACGRRHKLPDGRIARHGYTIANGWQEGTCMGSDHPPLEVSCDLVKKSIVDARAKSVAVAKRVADLRQPATEPEAWVMQTVYVGRKAVKMPTVVEIKTDADGKPYYYTGRGHHVRAIQLSYKIKTALDMANHLNGNFAAVLERQLPQIAEYIKAQTEVVATWQPRELVPIN